MPLDALEINLAVLAPALSIVGFALLLMVVDIFMPKDSPTTNQVLPWLALIGVVVTAGVVWWLWDQPVQTGSFCLRRRSDCLDRYRIGNPVEHRLHSPGHAPNRRVLCAPLIGCLWDDDDGHSHRLDRRLSGTGNLLVGALQNNNSRAVDAPQR